MRKNTNLGYDGTTNEQQKKTEQENYIEEMKSPEKEVYTTQKRLRANRFALNGSAKAAIAVLIGLGLLGGLATLLQYLKI